MQGKEAVTQLLEREDNQELWQQIFDLTLKKMTDPDAAVAPVEAEPAPSPSAFAGMQRGA